MAYVPPTPTNLEASNGPFVLGVSLSVLLTGILVGQTWNYFSDYGHDPWHTKAAAAIVCVLNLVNTGLDLQIVWNIGVADFGNYAGLQHTPLSHLASVVLTSFIGLTAQTFFALRSWRAVNKNIPVGLVMGALVLITFAGAFGSEAAHLSGAPQPTVVKPLALMWLWTASVTDTLISAVLMYRLWRSGHQDNVFQKTQSALNQLLIIVLSTAAITTLAAGIDAIFFTFYSKESNTHSALTICVPRLYGNCLLFTLNSRAKLQNNLRQGSSQTGSSGKHPSNWSQRNPHLSSMNNHRSVVVTRTEDVEAHDPSQIHLDHVGGYRSPKVSSPSYHLPSKSSSQDERGEKPFSFSYISQ